MLQSMPNALDRGLNAELYTLDIVRCGAQWFDLIESFDTYNMISLAVGSPYGGQHSCGQDQAVDAFGSFMGRASRGGFAIFGQTYRVLSCLGTGVQ